MNHCPEYSEIIYNKIIKNHPFDIILSGHTHGGQINIFGYVPFKPRGSGKFLKGWYLDNKLYVSKGIGTSILPLRFMSRAEISIFKLLN